MNEYEEQEYANVKETKQLSQTEELYSQDKSMSFTSSKQYNDEILTLELRKKQCRMNASVSEDLFSLHS